MSDHYDEHKDHINYNPPPPPPLDDYAGEEQQPNNFPVTDHAPDYTDQNDINQAAHYQFAQYDAQNGEENAYSGANLAGAPAANNTAISAQSNGAQNNYSSSLPAAVNNSDLSSPVSSANYNDLPQIQRTEKALGRRQLWALLHRNWLIKRRSWVQTLCECFAPILLCLGLVFAFNISKNNTIYTQPTVYANRTLDLTSIITGVATSAISGGGAVPSRSLQSSVKNVALDFASYSGPMPLIPFDTYILLNKGINLAAQQVADVQTIQQVERLLNLFDQRYANLLYLGKLSFSPNTPEVHKLVRKFNSSYTYFNEVYDNIYDSEEASVQHALDLTTSPNAELLPYSGRSWACLHFESLDIAAGIIDYKIRMNYTVLPSTKTTVNKFNKGFSLDYNKYYLSGYLTLQSSIEKFILDETAALYSLNNATLGPNYYSSAPVRSSIDYLAIPMPLPASSSNPFFNSAGNFVGLVLCLAMLYPVSRLMKAVVEEKESRAKETMKMMGLFNWVFIAAHFLTYFLIFLVIAIVETILLKGSILSHTNVGLIFVYFLLFNLSMLSLAFMISAWFNKAKLAGIVGPILVFALVMPRYAFLTADSTELVSYKYLTSLSSPAAFAFGFDVLSQYEGSNLGLSWSNGYDDPLVFYNLIWLLLFDFLLYGALFLYFEQVLPNEYGSNKPFYFIFLPSFWACCCYRPKIHKKPINSQQLPVQNTSYSFRRHEDEEIPYLLKPENEEIVTSPELLATARVKINNLYKKFSYGYGPAQRSVTAVNNLCLTMYENQITALLGHNGAGKSTTISILTGLIPATSGDCLLDGYSVAEDMQEIRKSLGVCPQHNVLFDNLTVREHLQLFATLKGVPQAKLKGAIEHIIQDVGLHEKTHVFSKNLSGGMKRKLSVAIALLGDSKIVFLDEPTSGMDPYSRRSTWELLKRNKQNRVIVLTTHFMDEADLLGDRIAIMSHGKLRCVGSSLFLKSRFGVGYLLTIVFSHKQAEGMDISHYHHAETVENLVKHHVPGALNLTSAGGELSFQLPFNAQHQFAQMFADLEGNRESLGVDGFGISMTTLEEVFVKIAEEGEEDLMNSKGQKGGNMPTLSQKLTHKKVKPADTPSNSNAVAVAPALLNNNYIDSSGAEVVPPSAQTVFDDSCELPAAVPNAPKMLVMGGNRRVGGVQCVEMGPMGGEEEKHAADISSAGNFISPEKVELENKPQALKRDYTTAPFYIQVKELLRKRVLCALRDPKALFFNVILPVIVVVLVLLILIINIDLAGPSLTMGAGLYQSNAATAAQANYVFPTNVTLVGNEGAVDKKSQSVPFSAGQFDRGMLYFLGQSNSKSDLVMAYTPYVASNSLNFSLELLENYYSHAGLRVGSFLCNDSYGANFFNGNSVSIAITQAIIQQAQSAVGLNSSNPLAVAITGITIQNNSVIIPQLPAGTQLILSNNSFSATLGNVSLNFPLPTALPGANNALLTGLLGALNALNLTNFNLTSVNFLNSTTFSFTVGANNSVVVEILGLGGALGNITEINVNAPASVLIPGLVIGANNTLTLPLSVINGLIAANAPTIAGFDLSSILSASSILAPITILHNVSSAHVIPAFATELFRAKLQLIHSAQNSAQISQLTAQDTLSAYNGAASASQSSLENDVRSSYIVANHPLPVTAQKTLQIQTLLSVLAALFTLIPFCYLPASFIIFIVKERSCKAKHLQLVSGSHPLAYWLSTFIFDMLQYCVILLLVMAMFYAYNNKDFIGDSSAAGCTFLLFFLYGLAVLPMAYCMSLLFSNPTSAQVGIAGILFLLGFILTIASFILDSIDSTHDTNQQLLPFYRLFPPYNFGEALIQLSARNLYAQFAGKSSDPFNWYVCGRNLTYLVCETVAYSFILLFFEYDGITKLTTPFTRAIGRCLAPNSTEAGDVKRQNHKVSVLSPSSESEEKQDFNELLRYDENCVEDRDVAAERHRIEAGEAGNDLIRIEKLKKVFNYSIFTLIGRLLGLKNNPPMVAVNDLYLSVAPGVCFGFLGVNGAGKTTTMSMLTGDYHPTSGRAFINNCDVTTEQENVRKELGYCPQFDPLLDLMTAREHLTMYARIRGVPNVEQVVNELIEHLSLEKYADNVSQSYSGGNKRKLSLGLALIGEPSVIFLDEPSTGMDPVSRRFMWNIISGLSQRMSVVLTTHSMEECEALCQRIGIMVRGRLKCIGSIQHLKNRFGRGYMMEINTVESQREVVKQLMFKQFPGVELTEFHAGRLKFQLPKLQTSLSQVFGSIESMKDELQISDYSISQSTLEQIFVNIARQQEEQEAEEKEAKKSK
jgi:ABC-type multidrug transport system ATPase subunit